jgi:hypothetical protein
MKKQTLKNTKIKLHFSVSRNSREKKEALRMLHCFFTGRTVFEHSKSLVLFVNNEINFVSYTPSPSETLYQMKTTVI